MLITWSGVSSDKMSEEYYDHAPCIEREWTRLENETVSRSMFPTGSDLIPAVGLESIMINGHIYTRKYDDVG